MLKSELIKYRARIALHVLALTAVVLSSQYYFDTSVALAAESAQTRLDEKKWSAWLEGAGFWNSEHSRGEVVYFAPLMQDADSIVFTDIRGKFFEEDEIEGNFALGMREMTSGGWNLGAWAGLDARRTEANNNFFQVSGGLEALHPNFDIRVNGYVSISDPEKSPDLARITLSGSSIIMIGGREVPLSGVDGEIGVRLPLENLSPALAPEKVELRAYGGGFYFDDFDSLALEEVAGVKARIALAINDVFEALPGSKLTLEYEYSHDDVRDDLNEVGLRLRIPLGGAGSSPAPLALASMSAQERRMMAGLERDTDIVSVKSKAEKVVDNLTNVQFNQVAYANTGDDLAGAAANGGNTLIIASGALNGNKTLQGNQTLQGGGSTIAVRGARSGTVTNFTAPGSRPVIDHNGNNNVLTIGGSNAHVAGVNITGGGGNGTFVNSNNGVSLGSNRSSVFIENTSISALGEIGINMGSGNQLTVIGSTISDAHFAGVEAVASNTLAVVDSTIANTGQTGIRMQSNNTLTVSGTRISNVGTTGHSGIFTNNNNNVKVSNSIIATTGSNGIKINDNNTLMVSGTTISNTALDGINMDWNNNVKVSNSIIATTGSNGINMEGSKNNSVDVSDTTFADVIGSDLIKLLGTGNTLTGTGNVNNSFSTCNITVVGNTININFADGTPCP